MLKSLLFFVRFFLFWLLFFFIDRLIFLFIYHTKVAAVPFPEVAATFYHALRLDLSMAAYLAVVPLFSYAFWLLSGRKNIQLPWLGVYNKVLLVLFSVISVVNFNIYREWGSKINAKALGFAISTPNEALASSASSPIGLSIATFFLLLILSLFLQARIVQRKIEFTANPVWLRTAATISLFGLNFLLIRGGWDVAPNKQSMAYFSENQLLNHAAVNTEWNLLYTIMASGKIKKNPYIYFKEEDAEALVSSLYQVEKDTSIQLLQTKRPNVVLVIMESFTADLTKKLGNMDGITPHFDSLISQGVLFSNIYSPGNRTDKGIMATLAGFPTLGNGSIVKWPEKMQKLPALSSEFNQLGYHTSFYYGGESEFDNYKAFILSHGYQLLVDKNRFEAKDMNSKWGAYDGVVFERQLQDLKNAKQPFFSTLLTITNHEPFEVPGAYKFGKKDNIERFKSTAYYTDSCINSFLNNARKQSWYANTLFIFVADHGHLLPKNQYDVYMPQRYHIPLLFYGEVIKEGYRGKIVDKLGSQQDLSATLLQQLQIPSNRFKWSKNLLNPYSKNFAFFSWDNGLGFLHNGECVTFDPIGDQILYNSNKANKKQGEETLKYGQAYLQKAYQQFMNF
jgi:phosphoglycerol transferase MdoB-like AlkP superfamily enzyme